MKQEKHKKFFDLEEWKSYWQDSRESLSKNILIRRQSICYCYCCISYRSFCCSAIKNPRLNF